MNLVQKTPEIINMLRSEEKLGKLESSLSEVHKKINVFEDTSARLFETVHEKTIAIAEEDKKEGNME